MKNLLVALALASTMSACTDRPQVPETPGRNDSVSYTVGFGTYHDGVMDSEYALAKRQYGAPDRFGLVVIPGGHGHDLDLPLYRDYCIGEPSTCEKTQMTGSMLALANQLWQDATEYSYHVRRDEFNAQQRGAVAWSPTTRALDRKIAAEGDELAQIINNPQYRTACDWAFTARATSDLTPLKGGAASEHCTAVQYWDGQPSPRQTK